MLVMVVTLLIGPGGIVSGNMFNIILGVVIFVVGKMILNNMVKHDCQMFGVFQRSVLYSYNYPSVGTAGCKIKIAPKRW